MTEQDALHRADAVTRTLDALQAAGLAREKAVEAADNQRQAVAVAGNAGNWDIDPNGHVVISGKAVAWPSNTDVARALATVREAEERIEEARVSLKKYGIDPDLIARTLRMEDPEP